MTSISLQPVLRIRIGFNADPETDPDPAFFVNADPDTDPDPRLIKNLKKFTAVIKFIFFKIKNCNLQARRSLHPSKESIYSST
jgi:hypothetical protein